MKKSSVKRIFQAIRLLPAVFSMGLMSCDVMNVSMVSFFKDYTENAAIEKMTINGSFPTNPNGVTCLTSSSDVTIDFTMRNPQKYTLQFGYEFSDSQVAGIFYGGSPITFSQSDDRNTVTMKLDKTFLSQVDNGNNKYDNGAVDYDISGKVTLYEPNSGRTFESYPVTLHANTTPLAVQNACFQQSTNDINTAKYIVCFYLPNAQDTNNYPHTEDMRKIYVNGQLKYFNHENNYGKIYNSASYDNDNHTWTFSDEDTDFSNSGTVYQTASGYEFPGSSGCPSGYDTVYYTTGINYSTDTVNCSLAIEDDDGLRSTVLISNTAEQLDPPSISDIANLAAGVLVDEISGTRTITISHDGLTTKGNSCGSVNIEYKVYDETDNLKTSGTASGSASVTLTKGKYKITAKATKPYYITSEEYDSSATGQAPSPNYIWLKAPAIFYVNASGDNINGTGAYDAPYRSIQKAIDEFASGIGGDFEASTTCEIRVMSNLTPCDDDTFGSATVNALIKTNSSYSYNIHGYGGKYTIDAQGSVTNNCRRVIYSDGSSTTGLTMRDLVIKGGYLGSGDTNSGGAGILNNGSLILENVDVTGNKVEVTSNETKNGAGIYSLNGSVTMTGCTVSGNTASVESDTNYGGKVYGAGIFSNGSGGLTMTGCTVSGNTAKAENPAIDNASETFCGIGIYCTGPLTLENSSITGNSASSLKPNIKGVGLWCDSSNDAKLSGVTITGNIANRMNSATDNTFGVGVYTAHSNIQISGKNTITGNYITGAGNVDNNLYLDTDGTNQAVLTVTGALTGSSIKVATKNTPAVGKSVAFTSGYGTYNSAISGTYFASDSEGYGVANSGIGSNVEAALAVGGGGISLEGNSNDGLVISAESSSVVRGGTVTFKVTDSNAADPDADIISSCTMTYKVLIYSDEVPSSYYTLNKTSNTITFGDTIPYGTYTVFVTAAKSGTTNPVSAEITVEIKEELAISELTGTPDFSVYKKLSMSSATELTTLKTWIEAGSTLEGVTITLTEDVDATGLTTWSYINSTFKGTLDGNGNSITFEVTRDESNTQMVALFNSNEGIIENLVVEQFNSSGVFGKQVADEDRSVSSRVAGISLFNYGTIKNCVVNADMQVWSTHNLAGITMFNYGEVINCAYTGNLTNTLYPFYGGLCAENGGIVSLGFNGSSITNCINTGTITTGKVLDDGTNLNSHSGAIIGRIGGETVDDVYTSNVTVTNCYWLKNNINRDNTKINELVYKNITEEEFADHYCNPNPENITGCGYFESLTGDVTAGDTGSCGSAQTLSYSGSVVDRLNAYVTAHPSDGLKKWKVGSNGKITLIFE